MSRFDTLALLVGTSFLPLACGRNDGALFDTSLGDPRDSVASLDHSTSSVDAGAAGGAAGAMPVGAQPSAGGASAPLPAPSSGGSPAIDVGETPAAGGAPMGALPGDHVDAGPAKDAASDADGGASPCTEGVWYADRDGDGYGRSSAQLPGCKPSSPPSDGGDWTALGGDCNDDDATVHPNQTGYFGTPYTTSSGESSYDYDCSGAEDGDPAQSLDPGCAAQTLLTCAGDGYAPTPRTGHNAFCGSTVKSACALAGFGCAGTTTFVETPYGCR
jgi:hypothetical protein